MRYLPRVIEATLKNYNSIFPVTGITGPRQSGKSTLLRKMLQDSYRYVTFDDYTTMDLFYSDPEKFMRINADRVIFDEAQKAPELFNYMKIAVDNDRDRYGKFIVTGSSQFSFMKNITESLAGRIGLLTLLPFQYAEIPRGLKEPSMYKGCYPEIVARNFEGSWEWYSSYIETYLKRDVRELSNIGDLREFRKCLGLLAGRAGQILNISSIANDLTVTVATVKKWISVLEASYIIFLVPPYYKNFGKRIVKSPKLYFYDTGLVSFLTGIENEKTFEHGPMYGPIFENYIVAEIMKRELHTNSHAELFYLRTSHGVEIDLIIDRKQSKEMIEIKASESFKTDMVKPLEQFQDQFEHGRLLYRGKAIPYLDNISISHYSDYLNITRERNDDGTRDRAVSVRRRDRRL